MTVDERRRGIDCRFAYWERVIELGGLLNADAQPQVRESGRKALRRGDRRRLEPSLGRPGPLTLEQADAVSNRPVDGAREAWLAECSNHSGPPPATSPRHHRRHLASRRDSATSG